MKGNQKGVPNERRRQSLRIQKPDSIAKKPEPRVHKSSKKSRPVREPVRALSVESLSASDESEREGSEREEMQPMQPLEFHFKSSEFPKSSKIQTKCFVTKTVKLIKSKPEAEWFTSHPQFRHFFHMPDEDNLKLTGMWMLLLRTICTPEDDVAWFAVNGVTIRYSMREHALISGLDCGDYPPNYEKLGVISLWIITSMTERRSPSAM
ncbi:uncharacterized protein LOC106412555 [Brassica napus]|nr:uncharacterized protein LOC106412555 [Brassica napus]